MGFRVFGFCVYCLGSWVFGWINLESRVSRVKCSGLEGDAKKIQHNGKDELCDTACHAVNQIEQRGAHGKIRN